ncbi:MAG TPA: tRNA (adenosine(37)-N6)-dimethylallyltransferase MiaA [Firmicutes bacterium]|nr:tRNA (adenosine(37)-N6)-dimethylallyltransferase MiaA [Bacillota bacterium]
MILAIIGPTAVGKTKLSIELAKKYNAIIINCDAMQVYKGLDIGTAKATLEEQEGITHELLDFVPVTQNYTVYDYQKDARKLLEKYQGRNIIFVGGTGLYLKSALYDYRFYEETTTNSYDNLTNEELYNLALAKDKNMNIHPNNRKRLVRFLNKEVQEYVEPKPLYDFKIIGLTTSRDILYDKINKRVDVMFQNGLLTEVKSFYDQGIHSKALETGIGYKELYQYFDNKITLDDVKELIKKNSRHYAKRQYTFFNHQLDVKWFNTNYEDFSKTINEVEDYIENC